MGLGETLEDRVDMVFTAKELGVKSVPVNFCLLYTSSAWCCRIRGSTAVRSAKISATADGMLQMKRWKLLQRRHTSITLFAPSRDVYKRQK